MYSGTNKNTFLSFERFKEIIDARNDDFELQLEGGEPLLNQNLYLFMCLFFF
jgi:molybdenum cofactor biosynthesis enzyme MoaA